MNIALIVYSFSGNTKKACQYVHDALSVSGKQATLCTLRPVRETDSFLRQCQEALFKKRIPLLKTECDISDYDVIIFASPVWAFTFAPALHSFLAKINDFSGKKCACVLTYGSGAGSQRALRELERKLIKKNAQLVFSRNLKGSACNDHAYLDRHLQSLIELCVQK